MSLLTAPITGSRSHFGLISFLALLLTAWLPKAAISQPYTYELVRIGIHEGPLPSEAKSGQMLDWTDPPKRTDDIDQSSDESPQRKESKAIKYSVRRRPQAVAWWTRPRYIASQRLITMEIYVAALAGGGSSAFRIIAYGGFGFPPRGGEPLGRKGPRLATAQLSAMKTGARSAAIFKPENKGRWPEKVEMFVRVSNGSQVTADVMAYYFERRRGVAP